MIDVHCKHCGKLLMRVETEKARVETVCPDRRCRVFQSHTLTDARQPVRT